MRELEDILDDILLACGRVNEYCQNLTEDEFIGDPKTVDAVIRNLEVIGEAIKQIPDHARNVHPDIPWRKIAGLRDILIHAYFGVDVLIIWSIASTEINPLVSAVSEIKNGLKEL